MNNVVKNMDKVIKDPIYEALRKSLPNASDQEIYNRYMIATKEQERRRKIIEKDPINL